MFLSAAAGDGTIKLWNLDTFTLVYVILLKEYFTNITFTSHRKFVT